ncbi:restriction endonuclease subunit S [Sphaerospermopsis kisseleviana CS-549]|uniref:Restriction endonuclease subunit S n=1 Tax=Sphaerospermopsis kisseleviana CS-549 TaxID=3021783 RepID=A0ABT4ZPV7_9CYAN|nr:restriction endonuclease subunit S [Sphaerospermopsis kisseleviana]MDB9441437.1 restriction endonuclease subunit S [Sphaerospermopsis kisseleviana CS-549]BAZ79970.1 type I restriction-modification system S subunit [Sphaerospermopsis kisseleviana NIES-73]
MGKYQGYDKYKDSSVEWLGDVPEHWEVKRVKYAFLLQRGYDLSRDEMEEGKYPVCASNGIIGYHTSFNVKAPSITVGRSGSVGEINYIDQDFWAHNTALYVKNFINSDSRFIFYLLKTLDIKSLSWGTAVGTLNRNYIHDLFSGFPPLEEQEKIARFLDYKTKQIDELIAKKETLIQKLDEKRTALISHAVTKGLDVNVPMKDSGIEWLGAIPQHWKPVRLKHITHQIIDGAHFTPTYVDDGIPFLRVTDIVQAKNNSIDMNNIKFIPKEEHKILSLRCKPKKGDLLYSKNGTIGVARIVDWDFDFSIFVSLCLIKVIKEKVNVEFLQYSLLGKLTETQINIGAKSNTVTNLHLDKIKEFLIALPTLDEQRKIIQYLDQKTAQIEEQKTKIQQAIDVLKEYRTALITNAVTGKIDVRKIPIPKI